MQCTQTACVVGSEPRTSARIMAGDEGRARAKKREHSEVAQNWLPLPRLCNHLRHLLRTRNAHNRKIIMNLIVKRLNLNSNLGHLSVPLRYSASPGAVSVCSSANCHQNRTGLRRSYEFGCTRIVHCARCGALHRLTSCIGHRMCHLGSRRFFSRSAARPIRTRVKTCDARRHVL